MAGKSSGAVITRYAGIQVQTSSLGLQIPVGWGTFRCKCNLIDYMDFKSKEQKSGKGGSQTTGYSYSATVILAICEGPIDDITAVYVDGKVFVYNSPYSGMANTGNKSAMAQAGLTLAKGNIGQSPWSYLTSNHPDRALGYSGLALAYASNYPLDSGATTPNHAFEIVRTSSFGVSGTPDADASLVVRDFFENTRTGVPSWQTGLLGDMTQFQNYTLAAGLLISPVIDSQRTASDFLSEILLATNSTCVWSEGVLKFIPYGDTQITGNNKTYFPNTTPAYVLTDDHYIPKSQGDPPVVVNLKDQSDAYNVVQMEYLDRTNQYNMAIALASDAANVAQYGERRKDPDTIHVVCTPAVAQQAAQLFLQRTLYIRSEFKFTLPWTFALLEPGDILELNDSGIGLSNYPVRITQIDENEDGGYDITAEDFPVGVATAPAYTMQTSVNSGVNSAVDPGGVESNLLSWAEDFTQSLWSAGSNLLSVSSNATTDPLFGTTTADKLVPNTTSGVHQIVQDLPAAAVFSGVPYTLAVYVKPAGRKVVELKITDGSGNNAFVVADTNSGSVLSASSSGTGTIVSKSITAASGGWYRVAVTAILASPPKVEAALIVCDDSGNTTWTGDGTNGVYAWGAQMKTGVDVAPYCWSGGSMVGPALFVAPPALVNGLQNEVWAAVAGGPNWGGANVWVSVDGTNYEQIGTITSAARFGRLMASTSGTADPDTTDTFSIDLAASSGTLTSASNSAADGGGTLSLLGSELISWSTATLTGQNRYDLKSYTRRGQMATSAVAHSAGETFVRLDDAVFQFPYLSTAVGQTIYVKFQSFNLYGNSTYDLSDCIAYSIVPTSETIAAGMAPGVNRVILSQFEAVHNGAASGWTSSSSFATPTSSLATTNGVPTRTTTATATTSGGYLNEYSLPFPVNANERLYVGAKVGLTGPATGQLVVIFYDSSGNTLSNAGPTFSAGAYPQTVQGFVTVPSGAVTARISPTANPTGAGSISLTLGQPMVSGATAGQTSYPNFVAGPASEPGSDVTINWTAAGISNQSPLAAGNSLTPSQVTNTAVPTMGSNLVPYSQFERGVTATGTVTAGGVISKPWSIGYDPQNYAITPSVTSGIGQASLSIAATATSATSAGSIKSASFPVTANTQLALSAIIGTNSNTSCSAQIHFMNSSNTQVSSPTWASVAAGTAYNPAAPVQSMQTVPAGAVYAWVEFYGQAAAAGATSLQIGNPMVTGVQSGQTTFPPFAPGPNSDNAADVTGNNTAAAIQNQGGLAVKNSVGSSEIDGGCILGDAVRLAITINPTGALVNTAGADQIQVTADYIPLFDQYGHMIIAENVNILTSFSTIGPAGVWQPWQWFYIWLVGDGNGNFKLVANTSYANNIFPGGSTFPYAFRVGATVVKTGSGGNVQLWPMRQLGQRAQYTNTANTGIPQLYVGTTPNSAFVNVQIRNVSAPSINVVPNTASDAAFTAYTAGAFSVAPNINYGHTPSQTNPPFFYAQDGTHSTPIWMTLEADTVGLYSANSANAIFCVGYIDNIGA